MFNSEKYNKLFQSMTQEDIAALLIAPSEDMKYLIDFTPMNCERFQGLCITADKRHFYICNILYYEDMRTALGPETSFYTWKDDGSWLDCVQHSFQDYALTAKKIGLNSAIRGVDLLNIQQIVPCQFINSHDMLENLRVIKSSQNITDMKKAARLADEVMTDLTHFIKPGLREKDIREKVIESFAEKGADETLFCIVASGENSSKPHYSGDSRIIADKDILILDFGCRVNGYCSDTSRTFFIGAVSAEEEKVYNIVLAAYQAAVDFAREGVSAGEVDKIARDIISNAGYGDFFINRLGHGIGFDVHEAPYIKGNSDVILKKGMAFSIEPGIYLTDQFGVRIEDIIIINDEGKAEAINHSSKAKIII